MIYVSFGETPEEAKGAIKIATNSEIEVTIEGESDISTELDLGGWYVVSPKDLKAFVQAIKGRD